MIPNQPHDNTFGDHIQPKKNNSFWLRSASIRLCDNCLAMPSNKVRAGNCSNMITNPLHDHRNHKLLVNDLHDHESGDHLDCRLNPLSRAYLFRRQLLPKDNAQVDPQAPAAAKVTVGSARAEHLNFFTQPSLTIFILLQ